jgi:hypothetical protein
MKQPMCQRCLNRRRFLGVTAAGLAGAGLSWPGRLRAASPEPWDPDRPLAIGGEKLRVQPILMYTTFEKKEKTSWKSWSDINTRQAATEEAGRISKELATLAAGAAFPLDLRPLISVSSIAEARQVHEQDYDVLLLYPATGPAGQLTACFPPKPDKDVVLFVRHQSGPTYYWYEALSTKLLKKGTPEEQAQNSARNHGGLTVRDVVVDDYAELTWRLRALGGLKNFVGRRIVALGGPGGKYDGEAPRVARENYRLDIVNVAYDDLTRRIQAARRDEQVMARAQQWTRQYLAMPGTSLETQAQFVTNAFLLYVIFKDWLREHQATAFTIGSCMNTVMPIAETTACLTLSWMNDEGTAAFCESDFVIIPPGLMLQAAARRPVFLCNSTFPHQGLVTCAHCTAPRRMDGKKYEPARILTHYESEYGAAPKVEMTLGQEVTVLDPEYATGRWVGFKAVIKANPFHAICRTQQDLQIQGDWQRLLGEARDSHWMLAYGDWLREVAYAAGKIGVRMA